MHDRRHFVSNRTLKTTSSVYGGNDAGKLPSVTASVDAAKVDGIVSPARSASPKRPTAN